MAPIRSSGRQRLHGRLGAMLPVPSPDFWHAHPLTIGYGYVAAGVVLVGALAAIGVAAWRRRREERSVLRKYARPADPRGCPTHC